jgi:uncharacterized protein
LEWLLCTEVNSQTWFIDRRLELAYARRTQEVSIAKQVAALPYRYDDDGLLEVMLITSRGRQRWIPPKGNLIEGLAPHQVAAQEAFEEAGVVGKVSSKPLGHYAAIKIHDDGRKAALEVTLFPLRVDSRLTDWPEKGQRTVLWFEPEGAAKVVDEPKLARLIKRFEASAPGPMAGAELSNDHL